jgi:hypothetical protein
MKPVLAGVCFVLLVDLVAGQERLAPDEARRYARVCVEQLGRLADAPIETDVDPEKACAARGEGGGAMAIPDRKLSKEGLLKAEGVVPVGQVWLRKWTVVVGGKPVPRERLRVVTIHVDDRDRPMPLLLLGVRKKGEKGLELVAFARDSEPLLAVPLKPVDFVQDLPLDLQWERGEKNVDPLTLTLFGKYRAVLPITRQ